MSESAYGVLRSVMLGVALLTIALGAGIYFILEDKTVGIAVAAFGVLDLLTLPMLLRMVARQRQGGSSGEAGVQTQSPPAEPDPSYNPYARED